MDSDQMMNLKRNLQFLMSKHRVSLVKVAVKTGIPKQTLHNWVTGVEPKNISQLRRLAAYFKLTVDELCFVDISQAESPPQNVWKVHEDEIKAGNFEVILRPLKR